MSVLFVSMPHGQHVDVLSLGDGPPLSQTFRKLLARSSFLRLHAWKSDVRGWLLPPARPHGVCLVLRRQAGRGPSGLCERGRGDGVWPLGDRGADQGGRWRPWARGGLQPAGGGADGPLGPGLRPIPSGSSVCGGEAGSLALLGGLHTLAFPGILCPPPELLGPGCRLCGWSSLRPWPVRVWTVLSSRLFTPPSRAGCGESGRPSPRERAAVWPPRARTAEVSTCVS